MKKTWMVRAGRGAEFVDQFTEQGVVAIGWAEFGDLTCCKSKADVEAVAVVEMSGARSGQILSAVSQVSRYLFEIEVGDAVVTYDRIARCYYLGAIEGVPQHSPQSLPELPCTRKVLWKDGHVSRDDLSIAARNTLGAIQTLFLLSDPTAAELEALLSGEAPHPTVSQAKQEVEEDLESVYQDIEAKAHEFTKDQILLLGWEEMQDLVAGVLRALGYRTRVSPPGADRGKDIVASPDGMGIESPRIRVEVKHRPGTKMGSSDVRSFIGGMREGDRGIYVSTGGFAREGKYEAERAERPVTLVDLDDLVALVVEHYEKMDIEARTLIPLKRLYWPGGVNGTQTVGSAPISPKRFRTS